MADRIRSAGPPGRVTADSIDADMVFDAVGLGYTVRDGQLYVSYPRRRADGGIAYGSGFPIGPVPATYWTDAPNVITAERVALWAVLLGLLS